MNHRYDRDKACKPTPLLLLTDHLLRKGKVLTDARMGVARDEAGTALPGPILLSEVNVRSSIRDFWPSTHIEPTDRRPGPGGYPVPSVH